MNSAQLVIALECNDCIATCVPDNVCVGHYNWNPATPQPLIFIGLRIWVPSGILHARQRHGVTAHINQSCLLGCYALCSACTWECGSVNTALATFWTFCKISMLTKNMFYLLFNSIHKMCLTSHRSRCFCSPPLNVLILLCDHLVPYQPLSQLKDGRVLTVLLVKPKAEEVTRTLNTQPNIKIKIRHVLLFRYTLGNVKVK